MHSPVSAEVRKLGVSLEADFALERLHAAVDVGVLFQTGASSKCLPAVGTGVTSGANVMRSNVALEI